LNEEEFNEMHHSCQGVDICNVCIFIIVMLNFPHETTATKGLAFSSNNAEFAGHKRIGTSRSMATFCHAMFYSPLLGE
jgi:hypothetical protein